MIWNSSVQEVCLSSPRVYLFHYFYISMDVWSISHCPDCPGVAHWSPLSWLLCLLLGPIMSLCL